MDHLKALYQKYRPSDWKEVKGQDLIINSLEKEIAKAQPSQAYIFAGGRGTGKTTIARIFAKKLGTDPVDLYEIDAATYTGVDQIREIIENTRTLPVNSKFKVYIIDETHMLSKSAFNALLKTLEEPPKHAIFILATTEPEKIPDTIISRCQFYQFKNPTLEILKNHLLEIAQKENFTIEDDALYLLALLGQGSFRDSLSILQKVLLTSTDNKITSEEIAEIIGTPTKKLVFNFFDIIQNKDAQKFLQFTKQISDESKDPLILIALAIDYCQQILRARYANDNPSQTDSLVLEYVGKKGENINSKFLIDLITVHLEMEKTIFKMQYFEAFYLDKFDK